MKRPIIHNLDGRDMKRNRQEKIKDLIRSHEIVTQEDLADQLRSAGFDVTQATVSRDIREMRLSKMPAGSGRQKYVFLPQNDHQMGKKYVRVLRDGFLSIEAAQNILVVKTVSGMAMAVAAAIDAFKFQEVVGSIAGDDTIMMAVRTVAEANEVMYKIKEMIED